MHVTHLLKLEKKTKQKRISIKAKLLRTDEAVPDDPEDKEVEELAHPDVVGHREHRLLLQHLRRVHRAGEHGYKLRIL